MRDIASSAFSVTESASSAFLRRGKSSELQRYWRKFWGWERVGKYSGIWIYTSDLPFQQNIFFFWKRKINTPSTLNITEKLRCRTCCSRDDLEMGVSSVSSSLPSSSSSSMGMPSESTDGRLAGPSSESIQERTIFYKTMHTKMK